MVWKTRQCLSARFVLLETVVVERNSETADRQLKSGRDFCYFADAASIRFGRTWTMNYQFSVSVINYRRVTAERSRGFSPEMIASRSSYRDRSLIKPPTNQSILDTSPEAWHMKRKTCAIIPLRISRIYFIINSLEVFLLLVDEYPQNLYIINWFFSMCNREQVDFFYKSIVVTHCYFFIFREL